MAAMAVRSRSAPLPGPGSVQACVGSSAMPPSYASVPQSGVPGRSERRRPGHFRICGACGKRNKARRAECARCGEPLRGIPEAIPSARHAPPPPPRKYRWLVAVVVLAAIAAGFVVHRVFGTGAKLGTAPAVPSPTPADAAESTPAPAPTFDPTSAERFAQVRGSVERGEKLLARGDFRGAALLLADAARIVPEDPRIANAYGRSLQGLGSKDRALVQFERAARLDTGVVAYRLDYARALAGAGRVREAAREYEAIAVLEPGNVAASEALARLQPPAVDGTAGGTIDMGGAPSGSAPPPARGGSFTNDDLARGGQPMRPASPVPSRAPTPGPSYLPPSPIAPPSPPVE